MGEEYVTLDQHWTDMRQLATDLKAELVARPVEVTVDLGPDASWMGGVVCLLVLIYLLTRLFGRE